MSAEVSLPHTCLKETTFRGYRIPKHSLILANLQSSNMDPKYWEEPELFRPERHLKDGKVVKNPAFVPFSVGRYNHVGLTTNVSLQPIVCAILSEPIFNIHISVI